MTGTERTVVSANLIHVGDVYFRINAFSYGLNSKRDMGGSQFKKRTSLISKPVYIATITAVHVLYQVS